MVEQRTENPCVVGSIPTGATTSFRRSPAVSPLDGRCGRQIVAVPELIVDRDRLIGLVRDGNSPEQIARTFRVEVRIVQDMIRRLEENGYYDLLREKG